MLTLGLGGATSFTIWQEAPPHKEMNSGENTLDIRVKLHATDKTHAGALPRVPKPPSSPKPAHDAEV